MRIKARVRNLAIRALAESMDVKTMVHVIRRVLGNYDLHKRTGYPTSVPIPNRDAARQIITDVVDAGMFLEFISLLMDIERLGMAGRKYKFPRLRSIVTEILELGYRYDRDSRAFVEDNSIRTTRNWGVLKPGESYIMAFLGVDVAGNSDLVRRYGRETMSGLYDHLRTVAANCAERRNGRLWSWEGDGGVLAFTFEDQCQRAVLTGIELMNEIFLYNLMGCPIEEGLPIRATIHTGSSEYRDDGGELKSETVKKLWELDGKHGVPGSLIVSGAAYSSLDAFVTEPFDRSQTRDKVELYRYRVECGES